MPLNGRKQMEIFHVDIPYPDDHDFDSKQLSEYFDNYQIDDWDPTGKTESQKKAQMEAELRGLIDKILEQDETANTFVENYIDFSFLEIFQKKLKTI